MKMVELTPVHAAVLAVLVLLLLSLAAVNLMIGNQNSGTGYLSGGVVEGSENEEPEQGYEQTYDSIDARRFPTP